MSDDDTIAASTHLHSRTEQQLCFLKQRTKKLTVSSSLYNNWSGASVISVTVNPSTTCCSFGRVFYLLPYREVGPQGQHARRRAYPCVVQSTKLQLAMHAQVQVQVCFTSAQQRQAIYL
jgi:hypothetical protein